MRFFENRRVSLYFHTARLKKDSKTGTRIWHMNFAVTIEPDDILACDEVLNQAYIQLETRERKSTRVDLGEEQLEHVNIRFFDLPKDGTVTSKVPQITVSDVELGALGMTRTKSLIELWFSVQSPLTKPLHAWVGTYYGTRIFADFECGQLEIDPGVKQAVERLQESCPEGGKMTLIGPDGDETVIADKSKSPRKGKKRSK